MKSLEILIKRWKLGNVRPFPPYGESIIRSTFLDAGIEASKDLIGLYGAFGGMDVPDDNLWRLWPLSEVAERANEANAFGVLFSDYLLDSWAYRIKPNDTDTSAVYIDYYDTKDPLLVARTLGEFFEKYVQNADELLNQPC
ncbi:hypothetical protein [Massilia genomosp. 1]|uniref:Knr4/Smi1-like domain-containing protein n=1 Tax=Massilia genomosp. 1 TaxID=2609280 RepID=A0ABX0N9P6_9BURK|nr:hypothetical protein [Massilia genomosp. 1]NHZ66879.1 hypothetical protein [Massilia genomosp. 1]